MCLPRVRFTVGQLLFTVAVVAANCGVLRLLCEMGEDGHGSVGFSTLSLGFIGSLPLINVALIGTVFFVARRLRSFLGESGANPRPRPAGVTYFSLHLLAIGIVVAVFVPNAFDSYGESLGRIVEGCLSFASPFRDLVPGEVIDCLVLVVTISGPALLLSWIGGLLARRCTATLPRGRFRAMTCLVSLGFTGVALAIAVTPRPFADEQEVDLDFQIVEKDSGKPIGAAFLRITDPFNSTSIPPAALTGADGRAQLTARFEVRGQRNAFWTMGVFSPWGRWLEVSAPDFRTVRIALPEVVDPHTDLDSSRLRKVGLIKGETPEGSFHDIAGRYSQRLVNAGCSFEIKPDGRFSLQRSGHLPPIIQEYGCLKRNEGEFEPIAIQHPGEKTHPLMTLKYRTIKWGDRLYLSSTEDRDLERFCQAALTSMLWKDSDAAPWGCLRYSDREKPQTGLPQLPAKVWVKFLFDKMIHRDEDSRRDLVLKSLRSRMSANQQVPVP